MQQPLLPLCPHLAYGVCSFSCILFLLMLFFGACSVAFPANCFTVSVDPKTDCKHILRHLRRTLFSHLWVIATSFFHHVLFYLWFRCRNSFSIQKIFALVLVRAKHFSFGIHFVFVTEVDNFFVGTLKPVFCFFL